MSASSNAGIKRLRAMIGKGHQEEIPGSRRKNTKRFNLSSLEASLNEAKSADKYSKLLKLKTFAKDHKKKTRIQQHKFAWLEEHRRMNKEQTELENELQLLTKSMVEVETSTSKMGDSDRRSSLDRAQRLAENFDSKPEEEDSQSGELSEKLQTCSIAEERRAKLQRARMLAENANSNGGPEHDSDIEMSDADSCSNSDGDDDDDELLLNCNNIMTILLREEERMQIDRKVENEDIRIQVFSCCGLLNKLIQDFNEQYSPNLREDELDESSVQRNKELKAALLNGGEILMQVRENLNTLGDKLHSKVFKTTMELNNLKSSVDEILNESRNTTSKQQMLKQVQTNEQFFDTLTGLMGNYQQEPVIQQLCIQIMNQLTAVEEGQNREITKLMQDYLQCSELQAEARFRKEKPKITLEGTSPDVVLKYGDFQSWSEADSSRFLKSSKELQERSYAFLMDRLKLEFPAKSKEELETHHRYHCCHKYYVKHHVNKLLTRNRLRMQLHQEGLDRLTAAIEEHVKTQELNMLKEQHQEHCQDVKSRLEHEKYLNHLKNIEMQRLECERREHEQLLQQQQEEREQMIRARQREQLQEYNRRKEMQLKLQQLQTEQFEALQQRMREELTVVNKERVCYREELHHQKLQQRAEQQQALEDLQQQRTQRLEQLRASVPYKAKLDEIEPSRARLEKATVASSVAPDQRYYNYATKGLFKNHGFTSSQIVNDLRFRMIQGLQAAGLSNSAYASSLLQNMNKPRMVMRNLAS